MLNSFQHLNLINYHKTLNQVQGDNKAFLSSRLKIKKGNL